MKLYHGSNVIIERIDLLRGRKGKDFGKGFYLSTELEQARAMAETVTDREEEGEPTVTVFEFDEGLLKDPGLKVKEFSDYSEEWVDFVVENRQNKSDIPVHDYDIVIGPIADDKVITQLNRFFNGYQDKKTLIENLKYRESTGEIKMTIQYFFGTTKAISTLHKCDE